MEQHEILSSIPPWEGELDPEFMINFLGVKTRWSFLEKYTGEEIADILGADVRNFLDIDIRKMQCRDIQKLIRMHLDSKGQKKRIKSTLPPTNENYFSWLDLIDAVTLARDNFVMIELGAGYGRWLVNAAFLLKRVNSIPYQLIGVEAEPTHYHFLQKHFLDNNIDMGCCELINKAITVNKKIERFWVGNPSGWYGQAIKEEPGNHRNLFHEWLIRISKRLGLFSDYNTEDQSVIWVLGVSLSTIMKKYNHIDYIDMDVQGTELSIITDAITEMNCKVKRIHIGTHSREIEDGLHTLFLQHGWICVNDYRCNSESDTPYGKIVFIDGLQTWVNNKIP